MNNKNTPNNLSSKQNSSNTFFERVIFNGPAVIMYGVNNTTKVVVKATDDDLMAGLYDHRIGMYLAYLKLVKSPVGYRRLKEVFNYTQDSKRLEFLKLMLKYHYQPNMAAYQTLVKKFDQLSKSYIEDIKKATREHQEKIKREMMSVQQEPTEQKEIVAPTTVAVPKQDTTIYVDSPKPKYKMFKASLTMYGILVDGQPIVTGGGRIKTFKAKHKILEYLSGLTRISFVNPLGTLDLLYPEDVVQNVVVPTKSPYSRRRIYFTNKESGILYTASNLSEASRRMGYTESYLSNCLAAGRFENHNWRWSYDKKDL